ncbi:hypothetical protein AURDEDRAFT_157353 [Auricularia subglabra TFB-10046 SS5]|nr:hypothetical protein AURDEDRAFT_157353 [Auricularia subglabra TFB-10046 SS5]
MSSAGGSNSIYWRLVNIDACVAIYLGKLAEGIWDVCLHQYLAPKAMGRLITLDELRHKLTGPNALPPCHEQKQSRLLAILPADVTRHIFDCFGDTNDSSARIDAARFALTCQMCLEIGHAVLEKHHAASHSWAGDRLIITGDYQDDGDLPAGLELPQPQWNVKDENIFIVSDDFPMPKTDRSLKQDAAAAIIRPMLKSARGRREMVAADKLLRMWEALFVVDEAQPVLSKDLVLRNLSKKQYVRGDVLQAAQNENRSGPEFKELLVGDLAAFSICWSSDPSTNMNADITRGEWAGDRFDVVPFAGADLGGWNDVSGTLVRGKLVKGIWAVHLHRHLALDATGKVISLEETRLKLSDI